MSYVVYAGRVRVLRRMIVWKAGVEKAKIFRRSFWLFGFLGFLGFFGFLGFLGFFEPPHSNGTNEQCHSFTVS
jgi:hypothetical protein